MINNNNNEYIYIYIYNYFNLNYFLSKWTLIKKKKKKNLIKKVCLHYINIF